MSGVPDARVSCLWGTMARERIRHRCGCSRVQTYAQSDREYSLEAARLADRANADLFLYTSYAWEAFTRKSHHTPRKVMFQYHPHLHCIERVLSADLRHYPYLRASFAKDTLAGLPDGLKVRERDAWRHADSVLCASSFTLRSLIEAGVDARRCRVVPYGISALDRPPGPPPESFTVLFVGTGCQRKGLHHLLQAWGSASLPKESRLTLVCRSIEPELEWRAHECKGVTLLRHASVAVLDRLFEQSTLFAMPSLIEGFGQVYLEALVRGCPVLGTPNTGLPDIGAEPDGVFCCTPGNIEELTANLESLSVLLPGNSDIRHSARNCAARFSWAGFRRGIIQSVNSLG